MQRKVEVSKYIGYKNRNQRKGLELKGKTGQDF